MRFLIKQNLALGVVSVTDLWGKKVNQFPLVGLFELHLAGKLHISTDES